MSRQTQPTGALDVHVIARRVWAVVIDYFILGLALGALFFLFSWIFPNSPLVTTVQGSPPVELGLSLLNAALFGLGLQSVLRPIYFIGLEGHWGQTIGKRILEIKVVSESTGRVAGLRAAIKRNLPRLVLSGFILLVWALGHIAPSSLYEGGPDYHLDAYDRLKSIFWSSTGLANYLRNDAIEDVWWVAGTVGLIAMTITRNKKRLGDMLAHTLVVRK